MIIVQVTDGEPPDPPDPPPPPPPVIPDLGFGLELITSARIWDLASGPVFALAGASGFGAPDLERWWQASPALNGSIHKGYRVPQRDIALPVEIRDATPDGWLQHDRDFWNSLDPDEEFYLRLTMPDATSRFLPVRLNEGGSPELDVDPMLDRLSIYSLTLTAGDPFWQGEHIEVIYTTTAVANLFPGPPFDINSTQTVEISRVTNPGDVPAWPRWDIGGPYTAATVGVGDSTVTLSTPIGVGDSRIIDMDPNVRSIRDQNGVDRWTEASVVEFEPIPPGADVELELAVSGGGTETHIHLHFDAKYRRAW